jgi:hypothetical protein
MSKTPLAIESTERDVGPADEHDRPTARDEVSGQATSVKLRVRASDTGTKGYRSFRAEVDPGQSTLATIRKARALTQATIAETLGMDGVEMSRLERHSDLLLSTFRRFIEATGGQLRLVARYPDREVEVTIGDPAAKGPAQEQPE